MKILSNEFSKLIVKEIINAEEKVLLEITDDSEKPVTSSGNIQVSLTPRENTN